MLHCIALMRQFFTQPESTGLFYTLRVQTGRLSTLMDDLNFAPSGGIMPSAAEEHSSIKATPAAHLLLGLYNGQLTCPQPITKPAHFSLSTTKGLLRSQRTAASHEGCRSSRAVPSDCGESSGFSEK